MNRSPATPAAGSLPSDSGSAIDGDTSTTSMMSSGVDRPVHGVPTAVPHWTWTGSSVIGVVVIVADATIVSFPIAVPAYVNVALPLAPVATSIACGLAPVTTKWTLTPAAGLP